MDFRILTIFVAANLVLGTVPAFAGPVIIDGTDSPDHGQNWPYVQNAIKSLLDQETRPGAITVDILSFGTIDNNSGGGGVINQAATNLGVSVQHCRGVAAMQTCFDGIDSGSINPRVLYFPGTGSPNDLDDIAGQAAVLTANSALISSFVESGGGVLSHGNGGSNDALDWLGALLPDVNFPSGCVNNGAYRTAEGIALFPDITDNNIQGICHNHFTGDFGGLVVLARDGETSAEFPNGKPMILGLQGGEGGSIEKGLQDFQVLGHDNINHNHVEIDISSGEATILGPSGFSSGASGMESARVPVDTAIGEFPPGTPFAIYRDNGDGKDYVVVVDRDTGAADKVVEVIGGIGGRGVGFGPVGEDGTQEFFATDLDIGRLYTIDLFTGEKTEIGPIVLDGDNNVGTDNLQWDADSQMFVSLLKDTGPVNVEQEHPETIIMIDPETGDATSQSTLSERLGACTVARNPFTGIWYSINTITSEFVQIDIDTGMVNPVGPLDPEKTGDVSNLICGMAFEEPLEVIGDSTGGDDHEPPTIGKSLDGVRQVVANGIGIDGQTWTVTKDYHQEFELIEMLTSPHTITNEIFCNEGYQECNHIIVAFMGLDEFFPTTTMKVEAHKTGQDWEISWSDPNDFIKDPDDENDPQDITFTAQVIDEKRIGTSFTIDFRNKDTGQLKLGIQVRDMEGGVRNFYFNEGVMFHDADGYPDAEAFYDAPLEVDRLCLNEDPDYRNSCAFAEKRQQATQMAEETLKQMTENQYRYN